MVIRFKGFTTESSELLVLPSQLIPKALSFICDLLLQKFIQFALFEELLVHIRNQSEFGQTVLSSQYRILFLLDHLDVEIMHVQPYELFVVSCLQEVFNVSNKINWETEQLIIQLISIGKKANKVEHYELQAINFELIDDIKVSILQKLHAVVQSQRL